jgi:hypothetical protein
VGALLGLNKSALKRWRPWSLGAEAGECRRRGAQAALLVLICGLVENVWVLDDRAEDIGRPFFKVSVADAKLRPIPTVRLEKSPMPGRSTSANCTAHGGRVVRPSRLNFV